MLKYLRTGSGGAIILVLLLGAAAVGAMRAAESADAPEVATIERAPDSNFPSPQTAPLTETLNVPGTITLEPAEAEVTPVTWIEAVEIAENEFGPTAFPDSVTASLAKDEKGRLVWAVSFEGLCVPAFGPSSRSSEEFECASDRLVVLLDAETGSVDGLVSS
jgi:hypothetical protein